MWVQRRRSSSKARAHALRACGPLGPRGFESHSRRQIIQLSRCTSNGWLGTRGDMNGIFVQSYVVVTSRAFQGLHFGSNVPALPISSSHLFFLHLYFAIVLACRL